jgi:hypothetical protein
MPKELHKEISFLQLNTIDHHKGDFSLDSTKES